MKLTLPLFLTLVLTTSVVASIATTVMVSQSLDRYLAQLNAEIALDRRALGSVRTVTGDGSSLEKMADIRDRAGAMLRLPMVAAPGTVGLRAADILASGVAITTDGWFVFPLTAGLTDATIQKAELATGDRTFTVDRFLRDERNGVLYVRVSGAAESVVAFSRTLALSPGDELYVTDMTGFVDRVQILRDVSTDQFIVGYDTGFESQWELNGGTGVTGILLDSNVEFVGFIIDGRAVPLHQFANSLSSAIQVQRLSQSTIGISGVDVTHAQNFDTTKYPRRGFLITTDATHVGVLPEGPGEQAGLQVGDMIVAIDGILVGPTNSITKILSQFAPGSRVTVSYVRDGAEATADVTLANAQDLLY